MQRVFPVLLGLALMGGPWLAGCSGGSSPSAGPTAVALSPRDVPTVVLLDGGVAPRAPLRLVPPAPGVVRALRLASEFTVDLTQDGAPRPARTLRAARTGAVQRLASADAEPWHYAVVMTDLEGPGTSAPLDGRRAEWHVDSRGRVLAAGVHREGLDEHQHDALVELADGFVTALPVLPEAPVGIGARWSLTETITHPEGIETRVTQWVLADRQEGYAVLTGESTADLVVADGASSGPGLRSRTLQAETWLELREGEVLPRTLAGRGRSTRVMAVVRPDGGLGTVQTVTSWQTQLTDVVR